MVLELKQLQEALEGNRRLTVRTIEAFPEDKLFTFSPTEPLRPFSKMITEILDIERCYIRGIAQDKWEYSPNEGVTTKAELLKAFADVREETLKLWPKISEEKLAIVIKDPFFGPELSHFDRIFYMLENEIHHRGQGYIYLRLLGIEPPAFYER